MLSMDVIHVTLHVCFGVCGPQSVDDAISDAMIRSGLLLAG